MSLMSRFFAPVALVLSCALPASAIEIQAVTSPVGNTAWLVEEHSIPMVSIEVVFTGGTSLDPDGREGAVSLMTSLLNEGAGPYDAQGFAAALEALAGTISFDAGRDSVTMSIKALTENRDDVIELAMLAITEARFADADIERVRGQMIAALERELQDPNTIAQQAFAAVGYAEHPYARPSDGTPETVAALTREDILDAHRAIFNRDLVYIGASGDMTSDELGAIIDRMLGELPTSNTPLPSYHQFDAGGGITVVDHPSPQSVVQFGLPGISWEDDDFMAAFIMNQTFGGGGFGSRLMRELREQRGLTYGVYTSLASYRHGDSFVGRFSTPNENVAEAIDLVREQFRWLAEDGITQQDLERAQTYLTGAYPLRFDGNESIANILAAMQFQQYDIDYVNVRNDLIRAVTLEDIHRVARRLAQLDQLHFVVVGQPVGVETTN